MNAVLSIARKDLRQRLRDRSAYITGFVAPLGLALIVGSLIGSFTEAEAMQLALVDADGGPVAEAFVAGLGELEAEGHIAVKTTDRTGANLLITDEDYAAAFELPAGLSEAVIGGDAVEIIVIGNPKVPIGSEVAEALATTFAREVSAVQVAVGTALSTSGQQASAPSFEELADRASAMEPPVGLLEADSGSTGVDAKTYYAVGMTVFFLFFIVQSGVLSLMGEREEGTMTRLLMAPIRPSAVIVGKLLGSFSIGLASAAVLVIATTQFVGADWGDVAGVAILVLAAALAAVSLVALVASFAKTEEQARGYADLAAVTLGLLGGSFFNVGAATGAAARLAALSPHRWLIDGFMDLNAGDTAVDILPIAGIVLGFAVVFGGIGLLRSRNVARWS